MPSVLQSDLSGYKDKQINDLDSTLGNPFAPPAQGSDSLTNPVGTGNLAQPSADLPTPPPAPAQSFPPASSLSDATLSPPIAAAPLPTPESGHDATAPRQSQFALGLSATDAAAFCGPAAAMALAAKYGNNIPVDAAKQAATDSGWDASNGMHGITSEQTLLTKMGVPTSIEGAVNWDHVKSAVQQGTPVVISTPGHYFVVDGMDQTGNFHVGTSGTDLRGGSEYMTPDAMQARMGQANGALYVQDPSNPTTVPTTAGLSGGGKSDTSDPRGIIGRANTIAAWLGDTGQKALHAVLVTEGGLTNSRGDNGKSVGPLQFFEGGQLSNYAHTFGLTLSEAKNDVEQNPAKAVQWAIGTPDAPGYLGAAIQQGQKQGLTGAQLATYAQQHGQVSVSPERAGQNYNALFNSGQPEDHINAADQALPNPFDAARNVADQLGKSKDAAIAALNDHLGDPFQKAKDAVGAALSPDSPLMPSNIIGGAEHAAGDAIANSGANQIRSQYFPNALEPNHPSAVLTDPNSTDEQKAQATLNFAGAGDVSLGGDALNAGKAVQSLSRDDLAAALKQYPSDIQDALRNFVQDQTKSGASGKDINNTLRQWVSDNPLDKVDEVPAIGADIKPGETPPTAPEAPTEPLTDNVPNGTVTSGEPAPTVDASPPPERFDPESGEWVPSTPETNGTSSIPEYQRIAQKYVDASRNPNQTITPEGKIVPGDQNLPGKAGGAEPSTSKLPSALISDKGPVGEPLPPDALPNSTGITPETMRMAHERINKSAGDQGAQHAELDRLVQSGADPGEIARFMAQVEGRGVGASSIIQTVRTGSLAGGPTTEAKVILSPLIQTAMRAPVGALKAIVTGHPGDIATGMHAGLDGLVEGAQDALQTIRYGTNYRAALSGSAGGGFGLPSGIDVLGKNKLQRALGTAAVGLVRTHGAASDISAGIGRNVAAAKGLAPEAAAEQGQQWAMRSGKYGTVGQAFSDALQGLKGKNPALDVVSQILVPFYRVGYNAMTQGVERSPLGIIGTGADVARAKLPSSAPDWLRGPYAPGGNANKAVTPVGDRLANNMFGVGLAALGLKQAIDGNLTGEHPDNNSPQWSVQVAGHWMPLRWLGPAGEALAQSAALYESARDGNGDVARIAELSASAYASHVLDESWLRQIGDLLGAAGELRSIGTSREAQATHDLGYNATSIAKSFIPQGNLLGQIGSLANPPSTPAPTNAPARSTGARSNARSGGARTNLPSRSRP